MKDVSKPLFLPLNRMWYDEFAKGKKTRELRGIRPGFHSGMVWVGREVVLSRGYGKKDRMLGKITEVKEFYNADVRDIVRDVSGIIPSMMTGNRDVIKYLNEYNQKYSDFIVFKIEIDCKIEVV